MKKSKILILGLLVGCSTPCPKTKIIVDERPLFTAEFEDGLFVGCLAVIEKYESLKVKLINPTFCSDFSGKKR